MSATKKHGPPIDRGWAWVVMCAVFVNMMFCIGYVRSFGILFFEFRQKYQTSSSVTALVMGIQGAVFSISGFLAQNVLATYVSVRVTVIAGGILGSSGIVLSVFAEDLLLLILTQSILIGCGNALIIGPGLVLLGRYFHKHRSLATAIANTGANVGAIAMPPLIRFLLDEFGMRGVFLIYGALTLHIVAMGALLRPIQTPELGGDNQSVNSCENDTLEAEKEMKIKPKMYIPEIKITAPEVQRLVENEAENDTGPRSRTISASSRTFKDFMESSTVKYTSTPDLACLSVQDITSDTNNEVMPKQYGCKAWLDKIMDFSLFRKSRFYLLLGIATFGVMGGALMGIYIPALGTDKGASKQESTILLSVNGATGVLSRIAVGFFADRGIMKRNHILALSMFIAGFTAVLAPLYHGFASLLAYSLVNGFFSSLYFSLIPVIIVDFLGLEKLAKTFGFVQLIHGASIAAGHPISGLLRDVTGSFNVSYQFFGASTLVSSFLLMLEPCARRFDEHNKKKTVIPPDDPKGKDIPVKKG